MTLPHRRIAWQSTPVATDEFPQQLARTRRFSLGAPHAVTISRDGRRVLFLRTQGGEDPVTCLWLLDLDGSGGAGGVGEQFEGAGLDGLIAKSPSGTYEPDKRVMFKIKHVRTADCVVAGYRPHKTGDDAIGSLLLGLYRPPDDPDDPTAPPPLVSVGVIGAFPMAPRRALRAERVVEVRYDHMEGPRFRHTAQFDRWRPDRSPASCTFAQLEEPVSFALSEILQSLP